MTILDQFKTAKSACGYMLSLDAESKNKMLSVIADALISEADFILAENARDVSACNKPEHIKDRLMLNRERIQKISDGVRSLITLPDPYTHKNDIIIRPNGLQIEKITVPLGVVGIIYEARPNVTVDVISLCLKTSNCVVLRGGRDAMHSNKALSGVCKASLERNGYKSDFIQTVLDDTREGAELMMNARGLIDVLLPRGSKDLIQTVVKNSTVPVIETGAGNCTVYVESTADFDKSDAVILNAKLSRPSVCNAAESLIVDFSVAEKYLPRIVGKLIENGVELVGCEKSVAIDNRIKAALAEDFYTEYNSLKMSVKIIDGYKEAVNWVNEHGTHHSDTIMSEDANAAEYFLKYVDSAAVYHNASTRFTDGGEFGFGAEMGISTQKLHARGPMGLNEMTTYKYVIRGNGQVRS